MDDTMSQEQAFAGNSNESETFVFDQVEETATQNAEETDQTGTDSPSSEDNDVVEQKVPYSRFKSKVEELEQRDSIINDLETRLSELESR